jgi:hypothetical protein
MLLWLFLLLLFLFLPRHRGSGSPSGYLLLLLCYLLRCLVVDAAECRYRVNQTRHKGIVVSVVRVVCQVGFLTKDHVLGVLRGSRQHAPVNVGAVSQVRVVRLLSRQLQNSLNNIFTFLGLLQEELNCSS